MRTHEEYRDDVCCCGATLPDAPAPYSWHDHGYCNQAHAIASDGPLHLAGKPAMDVASLPCRYGGPGFERDIICDWLKAARPNAPAILRRISADADTAGQSSKSWAWRLFAGGECCGFRLTAKSNLAQATP